jgi:hypothetical protein
LCDPSVSVLAHLIEALPLAVEDGLQRLNLCRCQGQPCGSGSLGIPLGLHGLQLLLKALDVLA